MPTIIDNTLSGPVDVLAAWANDTTCSLAEANQRATVYAAVAEFIEAAINVYAACRAGKEPDLIALADCIDAVGARAARKAALARIGGAK